MKKRIGSILLTSLLLLSGCVTKVKNDTKVDSTVATKAEAKQTKTETKAETKAAGVSKGDTKDKPITKANGKPKIATAAIPEVFPNLATKDKAKKERGIAKIKGDGPIAVVFWTSWCPSCKSKLPIVEEYAKENKNLPFYLVDLVDGRREEAGAGFKYAKEHDFKLPVLETDMKEAMKSFGIVSIPHLVVYDKAGNLVYESTEFGKDDLVRELADLQ